MSVEAIKIYQECIGELREKARKNCLAIAYGRTKPNGELDFQIASGFLYHHDGLAVFVTAGHVLDDPLHGLRAWEKNQSLEFVSLIIPSLSNRYLQFNFESWQFANTWTDEGFDLACMPISGVNQQLMWEKGIEPMPIDRLMSKEVSGRPSSLCVWLFSSWGSNR